MFARFTQRFLPKRPPRHRWPGWRRRCVFMLLLVVLAGWALYTYQTREARLIAMADGFLQGLCGGEVEIGRARFSFFGGIHLTDVTVKTPSARDFGPVDGPARIVFRAADLHLMHRPLALLLGRFDVQQIVAIRPEFQIVHQTSTNRSNWQVMLAARRNRPGGRMPWPVLRLQRCSLRTGMLDGGDLRLADPVEVELLAQPAPDQPGLYACVLRPLGADRLPRRLDVDLLNGRIVGGLPRIQISQVRMSLPAEYNRWCEILELSGQVGADSVEYSPAEIGKYVVNLSQVSLSVPLDESEFYGQPARARRLIRLEDVSGRIVFEPAQASLDLLGRFNGAPCRVWGTVSDYLGPLAAMGLDLHLEAQNVVLPDRRDPYVANQVLKLGRKIRRFFEIFDPRGTVGIDGHVVKPAGAEQPVQFRGTLRARDAQARYNDFPYEGRHVDATVRFTDEGILFDVLGRRGLATIRANGWVASATSQSDADVTVRAVGVPLDAHLVQALPARFRELWRHFDLFGLISCDLRIWRAGGSEARGPAPWRWNARVAAEDVAARYEGFGYLLTGLTGHIEAADGLISRIDLRTARLGAFASILGAADLRDAQPAVDLRVQVRKWPLTPQIIGALPAQIRRLLDDLSVSGTFDADLLLRRTAQTGWRLDCRGDVDVSRGTIAVRQLPYPFHDVRGRLRLDTAAGRIDLLDVAGRNGSARATLSGTIQTAGEPAGRFRVAVDHLPLDDRLYEALPAAYRQWWQALQVSGRVAVRSELVLDESRPDRRTSHDTTLILQNNEMCWRAFPLPLRAVCGTVRLAEGVCTIQDLTAACESGTLNLTGRIAAAGEALTADLQLRARDVPLDEPLRLAVPSPLRRLWNDLTPAGRIDLDLPHLRYSRTDPAGGAWEVEGRLTGRLERLRIPAPVEDAVLELSGALRVSEAAATFAGQGRLQVERATVSRIPITAGQAEWLREADGSLRLNRFRGQALGGTLEGFLEVEPTPQGDRYGLAVALDQAQLEPLCEILSDGQMGGATGVAQAQMRLAGLIGRPDTRSGLVQGRLAGQGIYRLPILLQIAEVLNIPILGEPRGHQEVTMRATIEGSRATVDSLELHDASLSMQGGGQVDLQTRTANVVVIAARPRSWPYVPVLTELFVGTAREFIEVHVKGPFSDLTFEARPLRSVQAALQMLTRPRPKTDRGE